jgi:1,2-diacylglycerol 3-alpha-glucosyltransferase
MKKLAVLFHRLGPYHHARLEELAKVCDLTVIEFSAVDNTYAWDLVEPNGNYPVIQLFNDADITNKPAASIEAGIVDALAIARIDAVAIPGWSSPTALAALSWCAKTQTPAILMSDSTVHDEPRKLWKEWIKSRVVRRFSSAFVAGTPHVEYAGALGLSSERIFTSYDVVDNIYFHDRSDEARQHSSELMKSYGLPDNYFLASNRFIEKKNLPRLVDAYASYLRNAGDAAWDLVLLGDGPMMPAIRSQVDRLGLTQRVYLPGFKQYDELPVFYGLAKIFIHASTSEQWGLVVNEAMASGLPVLVSERCGCAYDLVKPSVNGFTFDPYDVEGLASLMLRMSHGECDLTAMGQESRMVVSRYSLQTFAGNMLKAVEVALSLPRPQYKWIDRVLLWALMRR